MRKFVLILGDILILYLALWVTLFFRYGERMQEQLSFHLLPFSILFIIWLFIFYTANLYEIFYLKNVAEFYGIFFRTVVVNAVIGIAFFYLLPLWGIAPRRKPFFFPERENQPERKKIS